MSPFSNVRSHSSITWGHSARCRFALRGSSETLFQSRRVCLTGYFFRRLTPLVQLLLSELQLLLAIVQCLGQEIHGVIRRNHALPQNHWRHLRLRTRCITQDCVTWRLGDLVSLHGLHISTDVFDALSSSPGCSGLHNHFGAPGGKT